MCFGIRILVRYIPSANSAYIPKADVEAPPETGSAIHALWPKPSGPSPLVRLLYNRKAPSNSDAYVDKNACHTLVTQGLTKRTFS